MDVKAVQEALAKLGYNPGPIDGKDGRMTRAAVKAFQKDNKLVVDGVVGPNTAEALTDAAHASGTGAPSAPAAVPGGTPPWMAEAYSLLGTKEVAGSGSNVTILDWARDLDIGYSGDDVPWCGLFVAHCIGATLPEETLPDNPLGARNWLRVGDELETPVPGSILVFWRGSKDGWSGHVGFYRSEDDASYHVLGGNQSDSVSICKIAKTRLLGARWPSSYPRSVAATPNKVNLAGSLSLNEA